MSRTLTSAMTGHLATRSHTRCNMLLLDLIDGTSISITDHDKDITYDIGDGAVAYQSGTGILTSDISLSTGFDADNYEVSGPIADLVTLDDIIGGKFNRARARLFQVNWKNLSAGAIKLLDGNVSNASVSGGQFTFEIRSNIDRYNQVVGRLITNNCDADFADGVRCFATATSITGTVATVTDAMTFTVTFVGSYANDFFNMGTVQFTSGALASSAPVEIFDWTAGGGITLFCPLAEAPSLGDTLTIKDGCDKSRSGANGCMAHNAIQWFRGFPEVPGSDQVLKAAIPGQGNG